MGHQNEIITEKEYRLEQFFGKIGIKQGISGIITLAFLIAIVPVIMLNTKTHEFFTLIPGSARLTFAAEGMAAGAILTVWLMRWGFAVKKWVLNIFGGAIVGTFTGIIFAASAEALNAHWADTAHTYQRQITVTRKVVERKTDHRRHTATVSYKLTLTTNDDGQSYTQAGTTPTRLYQTVEPHATYTATMADGWLGYPIILSTAP